jgi:hypothetical protein
LSPSFCCCLSLTGCSSCCLSMLPVASTHLSVSVFVFATPFVSLCLIQVNHLLLQSQRAIRSLFENRTEGGLCQSMRYERPQREQISINIQNRISIQSDPVTYRYSHQNGTPSFSWSHNVN